MTENLCNMLITIISGVLVFIGSELFAEFILKPIREYKTLRGKVAKYLVLYANLYSNPWKFDENKKVSDLYLDASTATRELASEIAAFAEIRPIAFGMIPRKKVLKQVSQNLIGISNGYVHNGDVNILGDNNHKIAKETKILLKIDKKEKRVK